MEIGQRVVFKWLGIEYIGTIEEISARDGAKWYWVKTGNTKYPCYESKKFGYILHDKTEELRQGTYIKIEKTEYDFIMEGIEKSFDQLKSLHEEKFPKRKLRETREVIKNLRKQLIDLQKILDKE